ncbi:diacylglycerol/lipid kinase family protein [Flavobacterium subsaxonicum]|uniref:Diacylglycerol kinase n=1 Tax=Flavobacterium subsaxonicum WB 4.1-42 = DSM 21790 TaxID=1121898 RepID=A0A0A2MPL2_9FLAO|nr:YegS/Rv2252/BmrU family lipid kinase [Flavobacterium subsaxonicum]KGO94254.1 diacylglycerol kinase [Flavobacterium subsaxonicum WB 4.1-42 = DSM 21790]
MEAKKKFLLIINPIAGGNDKAELVAATKEFAKNENIELIEYETTGEDDETKIRELYNQHKPERMLVAGGDGTIKIAAEAVEHHDVIIGVLPAGSANGLSVDLQLPNDLQENLQIAFHNDYIEMDMVCINGKKSLHLSDIGANADLIKNYEGGTIRGKLGYALQAINTLTDMKEPFQATIVANDKTLQTEARMIVIANTQKYGTGVTINPIGIMDDGKFEIVILKNLDLLLVGKIMAGNMPLEDTDAIEIISTDAALITTSVPVSFQIDGEFCGEEDRLEIMILPKQMRVAVPKGLT